MKILNVDDNDSIRYARSRLLQRTGCKVIEASNGADALRLVAEERPDLVLLDVHLPDLGGAEVCRQLKGQPDTASIMILQISATFTEAIYRVRSLDTGADAYLAEPVAPEELIATVKALLRLRRVEEELRRTRDALEDEVIVRTAELTQANAALRREVAARHQAQEELEQRERQIRLITDSVPALIGYVGTDQRFRFVNEGYANWFGRPADDIVGREFRQLVDATTLLHLQAHIDRVLSGHPVTFEHQEQSSEGNQQWSYINLLPDFDEVAQVRGFFVLGQNITELKQAEAQVREHYDRMVQSEKLATMGTLLASVAHELNNPLGTLMLQVDALREDAQTAVLAGQLDELKQTAERCMYTVQNFLALSRQTVHQRSPASLNSVVEEALELIMHTLEMDDIHVQCDFSDALPCVEVNIHQFQQVILALLINAQQALCDMASAREICLTTRFDAEQERVVVEIADTGRGVPEAHQAKIFEPFYTTKPEGVGTGLGLSICKGIVVGHGGTLELVTPTEQGAVFRIELPIVTALESTATPRADDEGPSSVPLSTKTILLVDDNEGNAKAFAQLLRRDGHFVDVRGDGHEALETLNKRNYDLIICDVHMPRLEGPELYERLSATHPHLLPRFLFITGDMLSPEIVDFFQQTGVPHLTKPFGAAKARHAVQQVLASR